MPLKNLQFEPGCYVDGGRGIYAIDAIVRFAESLGFHEGTYKDDPATCTGCGKDHNLDESFADHCFSEEIEEEVDAYLNDHFPISQHFWGRNENGDWGLWAIDSIL